MATKKNTINDYKNRMSSPIGAVRIDPKTGKPLAKKKSAGRRKK